MPPSSDNLVPLKRRVRYKQHKGKTVIAVKPEATKLDLFLDAYVKHNGNGTKAAHEVFDCKSDIVAANIAREYLKKGVIAKRVLFEKKGFDEGAFIDVLIAKMRESKTPEWWDRGMKMAGFENFLDKQTVTKNTVNIMKVQQDLLSDYVEGEYVEDAE